MSRQPLKFEEVEEEVQFPIGQLANDLPFPVFVVSEQASILLANPAWNDLEVVDRRKQATVKDEILDLVRESVRNPETGRVQFMVSLPRRISNKLQGDYTAINFARVDKRDDQGGLVYVVNLLEHEEADDDFWDTQEMLSLVEKNIEVPTHFYWRIFKDAETGARMMSYVSNLLLNDTSLPKFDSTMPYNDMGRANGGPIIDDVDFFRGMKRILHGHDTGGFITRVADAEGNKTAFQVHGTRVDDATGLIAKGIAIRTPYYIDLENCRETIARQRSMNVFLSNAFVEVNEILTSVQLAADILQVPEAFSEKERLESVGDIHRSVNRAGELTSTMSTMLNHEMKRSLKNETTNKRHQSTWLTRKFSRFVETHLNEAAEGIPINVIDELDEDYSIGIGSQSINMLLLNLLVNATNAIKARSKREGADFTGRIRLYIEAVDSTPPLKRVRFSFEDNGEGMAPTTLDTWRNNSLPSGSNGTFTGVGLSTVGETVQEAGGTLDIKSTPGVGTTVIMDFPALPKADKMSAREAMSRSSGKTRKAS